MGSTAAKVVAAIAAVALTAGFAAFEAGRGGSAPEPNRPERALGPGGDAGLGNDPDLPPGGATAVPVVSAPVKPLLTKPLSQVGRTPPAVTPWVKEELRREAEQQAGQGDAQDQEATKPAAADASANGETDGALQGTRGTGMPAPSANFAGLGSGVNPGKLVPPDPNGDVGNGQYVQMVNTAFAVYDTTTHAMIGTPHNISSLFQSADPNGTGDKLCKTHDDGDPIVVYDPIASRWVLSQFALNFTTNTFAECIAVSQTSDATGAYYGYQFNYPKAMTFNDYPKFGVWPDAYYASFNQFTPTFRWAGAGAIAYDRTHMLAGQPATQIYFNLYKVDPNLGGMLPSDLDGATLPPGGAPNVFVQMDPTEFGYNKDQLELWDFHADFATPTSSTFTLDKKIATKAFNPLICGQTTLCVAQKGSSNKLDTLLDRVMFRLQYRNFGSHQTLVVDQSVKANTKSGVRWYIINNDGSGWSLAAAHGGDQGTFAPSDGKYRWMGSAALDQDGNLAVGYSISNGKIFPTFGYAGRLAGDPAGTLGQGERRPWVGKGSEKGKYSRWGDYSDLVVDPTDDCTFYYTNMYYGSTGQWAWRTRIVSFKFPSCS